jgi:hypothetical protein
MSEDDSRLKELLDGRLSAEEIAEDPVLASLAERIYGSEFVEGVGITRGATKRALAEQFTEHDGDDLLIEVIPESNLPMPIDMPENPSYDLDDDDVQVRGRSKLPMAFGGFGLIIGLANLFGALSVLGGSCTDGGCPADGHTRINWASIGNLDTGWGWSPSILDGSYGTPDIVLIGVCGLLFVMSLLRK